MPVRKNSTASTDLELMLLGGLGLAALESVSSLVTSHSAMKAKMAGGSDSESVKILATVLKEILECGCKCSKPVITDPPIVPDDTSDDLNMYLRLISDLEKTRAKELKSALRIVTTPHAQPLAVT